MKDRLMLGCTLLDRASMFSETYLNRDGASGKRPRRIRAPQWRRQQRKAGAVTVINCRKLDIEL